MVAYTVVGVVGEVVRGHVCHVSVIRRVLANSFI